MARSGRASRAGPAKTAGADPDPRRRWSTRRSRASDSTASRGQRPGDRGTSRSEPGPDLLPLRLGRRPAARGARRSEPPADGSATRRRSKRRRRRPSWSAVATEIFREDLDEGYVTVLAEMIAGAGFVAGARRAGRGGDRAVAGVRAAQRSRPIVAESPLASLVPVDDAAYAVVALYLGLEMLSHLDGDRAAALRLFDQASQFAHASCRRPPEARRSTR